MCIAALQNLFNLAVIFEPDSNSGSVKYAQLMRRYVCILVSLAKDTHTRTQGVMVRDKRERCLYSHRP